MKPTQTLGERAHSLHSNQTQDILAVRTKPPCSSEVWCLAQGHLSRDLSAVGFEPATFSSQAQFSNHPHPKWDQLEQIH